MNRITTTLTAGAFSLSALMATAAGAKEEQSDQNLLTRDQQIGMLSQAMINSCMQDERFSPHVDSVDEAVYNEIKYRELRAEYETHMEPWNAEFRRILTEEEPYVTWLQEAGLEPGDFFLQMGENTYWGNALTFSRSQDAIDIAREVRNLTNERIFYMQSVPLPDPRGNYVTYDEEFCTYAIFRDLRIAGIRVNDLQEIRDYITAYEDLMFALEDSELNDIIEFNME